MGRSRVKHHVAAAVAAIAIAGCQFKQETPGATGTGGGGGAGGAGLADAGSPVGTGGTGGTVTPPVIDAAVRMDASSMSNPDSNCAAVNQGAAPLPPDILILLGRSGSMEWNADATCTRALRRELQVAPGDRRAQPGGPHDRHDGQLGPEVLRQQQVRAR